MSLAWCAYLTFAWPRIGVGQALFVPPEGTVSPGTRVGPRIGVGQALFVPPDGTVSPDVAARQA